MENISFFILSIISILLGALLFANKRLSILGFYSFLIVLPTSNLFNSFLSISGVFFYDFYFLILFSYFIITIVIKERIGKTSLISLTILFSFIVLYGFVFLYKGAIIDKYLLRDFRPFLTLIYSILILTFINNNFVYVKKKILTINNFLSVLIFAFFFKIVISFIIMLYPSSFTSDIYYNEQSSRYIDATSFIAALFLVSLFSIDRRMINVNKFLLAICMSFSFMILIISNSRTLLAITLFLVLFGGNLKVYKKIIFATFLGGVTYFYVNYFGISRILSIDVLTSLTTRYAPAINKIGEMSIIEIFFGYGFRTFFEIPWFGYRGLDSYLNSIDSMYLTFFVKYGICSIFLIVLFLKLITKNITDKKHRFLIISFFLLIFLTYSPLYQNYTIIYVFYLILLPIILEVKNKEDIYKEMKSK